MSSLFRTYPPHTASLLFAGAFTVALLLLSGCSISGVSTNSESGANEPGASEPDDSETSEDEPADDAPVTLEPTGGCSWITADDAAAVLGAPITSSGPTSGHIAAIDDCNYSTDPTADAPYGRGITYQVIDQGDADNASAAFASMSSGGPSAGLGDESEVVGTAGVLVRFGSVTSTVLITGVPDAVAEATALQQIIAPYVGY